MSNNYLAQYVYLDGVVYRLNGTPSSGQALVVNTNEQTIEPVSVATGVSSSGVDVSGVPSGNMIPYFVDNDTIAATGTLTFDPATNSFRIETANTTYETIIDGQYLWAGRNNAANRGALLYTDTGSQAAYFVHGGSTAGLAVIAGDQSSSTSARIQAFGSTHPSLQKILRFQTDAITRMQINASGGISFSTNLIPGTPSGFYIGSGARPFGQVHAITGVFSTLDRVRVVDYSNKAPLNVTERSTAPTGVSANDIYLDDGSNTTHGRPGWRRYTGSVWEDIGATGAGGGGSGISWSTPVDSNIVADTSGAYDFGSITIPFARVYADSGWIGGASIESGIFGGDITGNAGTVTISDLGGDPTTWLVLAGSQNGQLTPGTVVGLTWDDNSSILNIPGSIAVTGTVDGRDVADDGATLDNLVASGVGGGSGITWSTPIDSNITVDTSGAYDIGTESGRLSHIYSNSGYFNGIENLDKINFNTSFETPAYKEGKLFYDSGNKCLAFFNDNPELTLQIGQENWVRVRNASNMSISNGSLVRVSGETSGVPGVVLGIATTEAGADVLGFATSDIPASGGEGYVTTQGIINGVNTSGYSAGADLFLSPTISGGYTDVAPSLPYREIRTGHVVNSAVSGSILVHIRKRESDYNELVTFADGMAFHKQDMYVVGTGSNLYFEVERNGGGGDVDYLIGSTRVTLDCTSSSGVGGRSRVGITPGADANTPSTNYLYITNPSGTLAQLNASTTLPTGAFGWVGKVVVPDQVTWSGVGEYGIQRYTESFLNNGRGLLSYEREKLRAIGAQYISGGTSTLNINTTPSPDSVHLSVASAQVYQLHRQTFPAVTGGPYYYGNGTGIYNQVTNLNQVLQIDDGTAIANNNRYNLVIWGAINYSSDDCKLFVNVPNAIYSSDSQAANDINNTADYTVPNDMRSVAFMIARVVLKYTSAGGGTFEEIGTYSLLGTPPGVRSGGAAATSSTEYVDSTFRIFDDIDATKQLAFEVSGVSSATTRTLTIPNQNGTIALTSDLHDSVTLVGQNYLSLSGQEITATGIGLDTHVTGVLPVANGGTNATNAADARTNLGVDPSGTDNSENVSLSGTPDYLVLEGQNLTLEQIDLGNDVSGAFSVPSQVTHVNSSGAPASSPETIDWTISTFQSRDLSLMSSGITFNFTNPSGPARLSLLLTQGSTAQDITWPTGVKWDDQGEVAWTGDANKTRIISFMYNGTSYYGLPSERFS